MPGYNTAGEEGAAPITLEPRGQPEGEGGIPAEMTQSSAADFHEQ